MNTIYTLINYVEGEQGWHDRCGDYVSGKDSECSIHYFNDLDAAGRALAFARFNNASAECTLLINGINPNDWYCVLSDSDGALIELEMDKIEAVALEEEKRLKEEYQLKQLEEERKKQEAREQAELKAKQKLEAAERAQLASLLAKYQS